MADRTCPDCHGDKIRVIYACPGFRRIEQMCPTCAGLGVLAEEHYTILMEAREKGAKLRAERLARDESLSEAAKRMGMTPVELSHLEHGQSK